MFLMNYVSLIAGVFVLHWRMCLFSLSDICGLLVYLSYTVIKVALSFPINTFHKHIF